MRQHAIILILGLILGMFGCASAPPMEGPTVQEVQQMLETSWLYYDYIAEQLIAGEEYEQTVFDEAYEWLINADTYFVEGKLAEAQTLVSKSLETFQQILNNFETAQYVPELENTLKELEQIVAGDPDNPLVEFLPNLQQMLDNAGEQQEKFARGEGRDLEQMRDDINQFRQLQKIISEGDRVEQEIGDVSFETGEYNLTEEGKVLLGHFADEIVEMIAARREAFPAKDVSVKLKVIGYTDDQGFRHDSKLAHKLLTEAGQEKPGKREERDTLLNLLLSEKRANIISTHLAERIGDSFQERDRVFVKEEGLGKGNAIPPSVDAPYPKEDARRRISRIYSYVIAN
ncbi:MAG: hypothetical protein GY801_03735 [bacterium]|nr:hypothetical protein [bacterium]